MVDSLAAGTRQIVEAAHTFASSEDVLSALREIAQTTTKAVTAIGDVRSDLSNLKTLLEDKFRSERDGEPTSHEMSHLEPKSVQHGASVALLNFKSTSVSQGRGPSSPRDESFVATTLPLAWPSSLPVRKINTLGADLSTESYSTSYFTESDKAFVKHATRRFVNRQQASGRKGWLFANGDYCGCVAMFAPFSSKHQLFEILGLLMLLMDSITIPFSVSFQHVGIMIWVHSISLCYWNIHMAKSFTTGYYSKAGELVTGAAHVVRNYFTTWFLLDVTVLALDWWSMYLLVNESDVPWVALVALLRGARVNALLRTTTRFFETTSFFDRCENFIQQNVPDTIVFLIKKIWLVFVFVFAGHILCCVWYGIGSFAPSDTGSHWKDVVAIGSSYTPLYFFEMGPGYQYSTCFLWGVSQIALAGSEIVPQSSLERCVSAACVIGGFLFGSALISLLSASLIEYQMLKKDITQKLRTLRQFLHENRVVEKVAIKVTTQAIQSLAKRERLLEKDVLILTQLSSQVLRELRFAIRQPHLEKHALFRLCISFDTKLVQTMCSTVVDMMVLSQADEIFLAGHDAISMYHLISGTATYLQEPKTSPVVVETRASLSLGTWLAEAALWSQWIHVGTAQSEDGCCLLTISPLEFLELTKRNWIICCIFGKYCEYFHEQLCSAKPPSGSWPNDLHVPYCDYCDIVVSMPKHLQIIIGLDALQYMSLDSKKLRDEVESAKSLVIVNGNGDIFRVVSLVIVQVISEEGEWFVQIGKQEQGRVVASCQLPGCKIESEETSSDAIDRVLKTKLPFFQNKTQVIHSNRTHTEKESREYGVRTRYFRTTYAMELLPGESLNIPTCTQKASSPGDVCADTGRESWIRPQTTEFVSLSARLTSKDVMCIFKSQDLSSTDASLYAWLSPEDFEYLCSSAGERVLKLWLDLVEIPRRAYSNSDDTQTRSSSHGVSEVVI